MFSRFTRLFKKNDLDEQKVFQTRVARILSELYPDKTFQITEDPLTLACGESVLGLTNIKANFLFGPQNDSALRSLLSEHFGRAFLVAESVGSEDASWEAVRLQVMPQLMPRSFLEKLDLIHFPFDDEVVLGMVIDTRETYSYVLKSSLDQWGVTGDEIRRTAIENLSKSTKGVEMTVVPGENGLLVIQTMDGFDAVRIIDPEMRSFIAEQIGSPFYFGVPNRDFLICWSKNSTVEFHDQMRSQISADCDEQPYPLSRLAFEVTSENEIRLAALDVEDPRAENAVNN